MADRDPLQTEHARLFEDAPGEAAAQRTMEERATSFGGDTREDVSYDPIDVDLDAPVPPKPSKDGKPQPVLQPRQDPAVDELQRQLQAQRQATAQAAQAAQEFANRAAYAERRSHVSTVSMIDSAIGEAQQASQMAKARYANAMNAGNYSAAAEHQEEISAAQHNLLRLQEQKAMVETEAQRAPQPQQQYVRNVQQQPQQMDPNATLQGLVNDGFPKSAQWLQRHPELLNPSMLKKVASAHNHLVDNGGMIPETDAYFSALERELYGGGQRQPAAGPSGGARRPAAAAPVNQSSVSLRSGESRRGMVHLTPEQRQAAAEIHGMTDREFAEEYESARAAGNLMMGRIP
jgi:hypothetical protein